MNYTFGLIGCGNMGSAVARTVSQVTHNGILANRTPKNWRSNFPFLGEATRRQQKRADSCSWV